MSPDLKIGFARRDISPPALPEGDPSIPILGFHWQRARAYTEIHDPLYARAMAVQSGDVTTLVFACDLFGDAIGLADRAARRLEAEAGVASDRVFFGSTHTHTSPDTLDICPRPVASWWVDQLVEQLVGTATDALESLQPASLHWGEIDCPGVAHNRRTRYLEPYEKQHGPIDSAILARNTALDEKLRVLCAVSPDSKPFGAIANFGCHPVIVQTMPMISADYCGPAAGHVEEAFDAGFTCLYLNGPCGDINPICNNTFDYEDCVRIGSAIATKALTAIECAQETEPIQVDGIAANTVSVSVERQDLPNAAELRADERRLLAECQQAEADGWQPEDGTHPASQLNLTRERLAILDMPEERSAVVHALRVGEVRFVSFPGELLTALALDVRQGIGGKSMLGHCVRGHVGYICPREAYVIDGYETGPGVWGWLKEGCGEAIAAGAVRAARQL